MFIANFTLNGAEEDFSFLEMMDEIANLKSPFFGMFRDEKTDGSILAQIISGNYKTKKYQKIIVSQILNHQIPTRTQIEIRTDSNYEHLKFFV